MQKKKKRGYNLALIIGNIIIGIIMLIMIMEESLIKADPYSLDFGVQYIVDNEVIKIEHPVKPNPIDKFGTDPLGRDILSTLISGTKVTVGVAFLSAIIRIILGAGISIWRRKEKGKAIILKYILSILVSILISYGILSISFFKKLELLQAVLAYSLVIGLFGSLRVSMMVSLDKEAYENMDKKEIKDIINLMLPNISINFFKEIGISLLTLCALAFLGITIGVNKFIDIKISWGPVPNYYPEWGGLLTVAPIAAKKGAYWLISGPMIFFVMGILGFLLISKGLANNLKREGSVVSTPMRKVFNFFSPKQYIDDMKRFSWNKGRAIGKTLIIATILFLIIRPSNAGDTYQIDGTRAWKDLEYINQVVEQYGDNSEETKNKVAEYIEEQLQSIRLLYPVFGEEFVQDIDGKGKNIAGYIWGRSSNNPLVLVADYGKDFKENSTSIAALLELARSLGEKHQKGMASRTVVFLFVDGTLENGRGVSEAIGNTNIERKSFYIDLNYIGVDDRVFIDTSTVLSESKRHYRNIRLIKGRIKDMNVPLTQEYFDGAFENTLTFMENRISGLAISGASIEEHEKYGQINLIDTNSIDRAKFEKHTQLIMDIATRYAWSDKPWLGDRY